MNQKDEASLRKTAVLIWRCAQARSVLEQGTITPYGLLALNEVVGGQGLHLGSAGPDGAQLNFAKGARHRLGHHTQDRVLGSEELPEKYKRTGAPGSQAIGIPESDDIKPNGRPHSFFLPPTFSPLHPPPFQGPCTSSLRCSLALNKLRGPSAASQLPGR